MMNDDERNSHLGDNNEAAGGDADRATRLPGADMSENQDTGGEINSIAGNEDSAAAVEENQNPVIKEEHIQKDESREAMEEGEVGELKHGDESRGPQQEDESREPMEEAESVESQEKAKSAELHFDQDFLSHFEFKTVIQDTIGALIKNDPLLSDLHPHVTVQEVNALIELEHGRAMTVYVEREDGQYWSVVVPREATVHDFKTALKHAVTLKMNRLGTKKKVSWKFVWKTYTLCYDGQKLEDDNAQLLDFGIRNKSSLTFKKKLNERQRIRHAARSSDERTVKL